MNDYVSNEHAEFGVLFVDGIGKQRPGSAVTSLAAALYGWLFEWNEATCLSTLDAPVLHQTVLSGEDSGGAPAHVKLESWLRLGGDGRQASWLLAESAWAEAHSPPRFLDLAHWFWKVSTCLLVLQFVIPMRRHWRRYLFDRGAGVRWYRRLDSAGASLGYLVLMGVAAMLSIFMSALLLALSVAAYLPIPRIDAAVRWLVVKLSSVFGDSYLLAHCPVQLAAMRTQVEQDLAWLQEHCDVVAVVAHSQGAAIAHQVLHGSRDHGNVRAFITVGQGISKLRFLQCMDWDPDVAARAWRSRFFLVTGLFLAGLPAIGVVLGRRIGLSGLDPLAAFPVFPALIAAGFLSLVAGVGHALRAVRHDDRDLDLALPGLAWRDYYASADPVSNGPFTAAEQDEKDDDGDLRPSRSGLPDCRMVYNKGSLFTDHTSYLRNRDQFLSRLLNDLVVAAYGREYPADRQPRLAQDDTGKGGLDWAGKRRRHLVDWLIAGRVMVVALGIALWLIAPARLMDRSLNDVIRLSDSGVGVHGLTARFTAISVIMIGAYLLGIVVPWRIMERRSARQFFAHAVRLGRRSRAPRPARGGSGAAVSAGGAAPVPAAPLVSAETSDAAGAPSLR